jgi:hypothetical protein
MYELVATFNVDPRLILQAGEKPQKSFTWAWEWAESCVRLAAEIVAEQGSNLRHFWISSPDGRRLMKY